MSWRIAIELHRGVRHRSWGGRRVQYAGQWRFELNLEERWRERGGGWVSSYKNIRDQDYRRRGLYQEKIR